MNETLKLPSNSDENTLLTLNIATENDVLKIDNDENSNEHPGFMYV